MSVCFVRVRKITEKFLIDLKRKSDKSYLEFKLEVEIERERQRAEEGEAIKWILRKSGAAFALYWIGF